jgi:hypothetical protein
MNEDVLAASGHRTPGRGGRTRTDDLSDPNRALYQAELRPVLLTKDSILRLGNNVNF